MKKLYLSWGWLLGMAFLALPYLWTDPYPENIDIGFHLRFAEDFSTAMSEGDGWPDWDARPFHGRGTSAFRYYAPLPYLGVSLFRHCGFSICAAFKILMLVAAAIGALGMRRWVFILGWPWALEWVTLLCLTSPPVLIHFYMVFFFQNFVAMMFFPWLLAGWWDSGTSGRGTLVGIAALALMGWCHLPSAMMAGYAILVLAVVEAAMNRIVRPLSRAAFIVAGSGMLMAPYALPALLTRGEISFDRLQAVFPWVYRSFLDSLPFDPDHMWDHIRKMFLFVTIFLVTGMLGGAMVTRKSSSTYRHWWWCVFPVIFFLFLNLQISAPVWRILPGLPVLQMPWRLLFPASFLVIPFFLIPLSPGASFRPFFRIPGRTLIGLGWVGWIGLSSIIVWNHKAMDSKEIPKIMSVGIGYPVEYLPRTCPREDLPCQAGSKPLPRVSGASSAILLLTDRMAFSEWQADLATGPASCTLDIHWDPCWRLSIDDCITPIQLEATCGVMLFNIEAGKHNLRLTRVSPGYRDIGWLLGGIALIAWLYCSVRFRGILGDG
ncbi:MAG: hypothetical protein HQM09_07220 [Candidatus Riflebacteria bacterium]|nr:hypothetical protein [Candidatus Riflebacteria bacterium]